MEVQHRLTSSVAQLSGATDNHLSNQEILLCYGARMLIAVGLHREAIQSNSHFHSQLHDAFLYSLINA
jgi:hypothetical protein